jgi:transposase InsO family protein
MATYRKEFKITSMARYLDVSRSGFYDYVKRSKNPIGNFDIALIDFVKEAWISSKKSYGLIRILNEVKGKSLGYGARKVRKAMNLLQIRGKQDKKYRVSTTDSKHSKRIAPDLVQRKFKVERKDEVWVSDVTFIRCFSGWLYLCVIIDLYSRKVVSWKLSTRNDSELIVGAITLAIDSRNPSKGLIFHTDRGSNYCSGEVRKILANNRIRRSNSRKGNCWDNAVAESFFATLKREIEFNVFQNLKDAKNNIFDYIEVFYNRQRSHSFLGYVSPEKFELKMN